MVRVNVCKGACIGLGVSMLQVKGPRAPGLGVWGSGSVTLSEPNIEPHT